MKTQLDVLTRDLFEVPVELNPTPGALDCGDTIRHVLADLIKRAPHPVSHSATLPINQSK